MRLSAQILSVVLIVHLLASCTQPKPKPEVGPCLSAAPADMEEDPTKKKPKPDASPDAPEDPPVGPRLSIAPDRGATGELERPSPDERTIHDHDALLQKFAGRLPGDVLARLKDT